MPEREREQQVKKARGGTPHCAALADFGNCGRKCLWRSWRWFKDFLRVL